MGKKQDEKVHERDIESKSSDSGNESDNVSSPEKDELAKPEKTMINVEKEKVIEEIAVD